MYVLNPSYGSAGSRHVTDEQWYVIRYYFEEGTLDACRMQSSVPSSESLIHTRAILTTMRSYTSTALCVAVATGYSCGSSNPPNGSISSNVEGTISGSRPCVDKDSLS